MEIGSENDDASPEPGDVDVELVDQETLRIQDIVPTLPATSFFGYNKSHRRTLGFPFATTPVQFEYYFRPCVTGAIHKDARGVEHGILLPDINLDASFEGLLNYLNIPYTTDSKNFKIHPEIRLIFPNHLQKFIEFGRIVEEHINKLVNPYLQQHVSDNRNDNESDYFDGSGGNSSSSLEQPVYLDENNQAVICPVQNVDNDGTNQQEESIDPRALEDGSGEVEESGVGSGSVPRAEPAQGDRQNIIGQQQDQNANAEQTDQLATEQHRNAQGVTELRRKRKTESSQKGHLSSSKRAMLSDSTTEFQPGTSGDTRSGTSGDPPPGISGDPPPSNSGDQRPGTSGDTQRGTSGDLRPGAGGESRPGTSGAPQPGKSGDPRPDKSSDPRPGTSGDHRPGTSGDTQRGTSADPRPGAGDESRPGTSGAPQPGKSDDPRPGTSGDSRSDSSGTQNQQIASSEDDILNRNVVDFPKYRADIIFTPDLYGQQKERRVSTESRESTLSPDMQQGILNSLASQSENVQRSEEHSSDDANMAEELRKKILLCLNQYKTLTMGNIRKCMKELNFHKLNRDVQERILRSNMHLLQLINVVDVFEGYILKYLQIPPVTNRNVEDPSSLPEQQLPNPGLDPLLENITSPPSDSSSDLE